MVARKIPCIIIVSGNYLKENNLEEWQINNFEEAIKIDGIKKYYFGDDSADIDRDNIIIRR